MTSAALAHAPNIRTSTATIDVVRAASNVATKITAAAATVSSVSALSSRFVDVAVVIAAQATITVARTIAVRLAPSFQARAFEVAQNTPTASSATASARNASSFGRL